MLNNCFYWIKNNKSKFLSLVVVAIYSASFIALGGLNEEVMFAILVINLPLVLIWFGESLGKMTGFWVGASVMS